MAGESILIVDDSPLNLKFARLLLESEGYVTATAKEGNDALSTINTFKPQLILMDVQMPGIDGLELTRHIKANLDTRDIIVVALTAYAMPQDEERARNAGCDGYVSKPFDSQKLLAQIRQYFDAKGRPELHLPKRLVAVAEATDKADAALLSDVSAEQVENVSVHSITREFLVAGEQQSRRLYDELKTGLDVQAARRHLHQWAGIGTTLGFPQISQAARAIGTLLEFSGSNVELLEARCKALRQLFSDASNDVQRGAPVRAEVIEILSHRSVALIGFAPPEASQTQQLLQQAGAFCESVEPDQLSSGTDRPFDIAILKLTDTEVTAGTEGDVPVDARLPWLLVGPREFMVHAQLESSSHLRDFLIEPYSVEEILLRCCQLILRTGVDRSAIAISASPVLSEAARGSGALAESLPQQAKVLVVDDDPTVIALVTRTLEGSRMECLAVSQAKDVVRMAAEFGPHVIVLDVNLPHMDGFEVLTSLKNDEATKNIAVVMLTARQQESDIMKGFGLGAADYIVKPFSPMELLARVRRLVRQ